MVLRSTFLLTVVALSLPSSANGELFTYTYQGLPQTTSFGSLNDYDLNGLALQGTITLNAETDANLTFGYDGRSAWPQDGINSIEYSFSMVGEGREYNISGCLGDHSDGCTAAPGQAFFDTPGRGNHKFNFSTNSAGEIFDWDIRGEAFVAGQSGSSALQATLEIALRSAREPTVAPNPFPGGPPIEVDGRDGFDSSEITIPLTTGHGAFVPTPGMWDRQGEPDFRPTIFLDFESEQKLREHKFDPEIIGKYTFLESAQGAGVATLSPGISPALLAFETQSIFDLSGLDIRVTTARPSPDKDYVTVVFSPQQLTTPAGAPVLGGAFDILPKGSTGFEGIDRFNVRKDGTVTVFHSDSRTLAQLAETIAHESGHSYGLYHVDPNPEPDSPGQEVLDHQDSVFPVFWKQPTPLVRPGVVRSQPLSILLDHNPQYHLRRYVLGEQSYLEPGSYDTKSFSMVLYEWGLDPTSLLSIGMLRDLTVSFEFADSTLSSGADDPPLASIVVSPTASSIETFLVGDGEIFQVSARGEVYGIDRDIYLGTTVDGLFTTWISSEIVASSGDMLLAFYDDEFDAFEVVGEANLSIMGRGELTEDGFNLVPEPSSATMLFAIVANAALGRRLSRRRRRARASTSPRQRLADTHTELEQTGRR